MAKIIVKLENGAYNYYEDEKLVKGNLSVRTVKKDENGKMTVGDIVLPENPTGKKTISTTRFKDGITEYDFTNVTVKTKTTTTATTAKRAKIDLNEYYTEEERTKIDKLQAQIDKINEAVTKRAEIAMAEQALIESAMGLTIEQLQAITNAKTEAKA